VSKSTVTGEATFRPINRRCFLGGGIAIASGLLLGACDETGPSSTPMGTTMTGPGGMAHPDLLRIAYQPALGHRAVLMAATGYAQRALGVPVEFTLQASGPMIAQRFAQGQLDIAYMGPVPALIAIDKGVPFRMVAADHWNGYSLVGRKGRVKTVAQLGGDRTAAAHQFRGETIGAFAKGSSQDIICRWFFAQAGMQEGRDYTIRNYQGPDAISLMRAGALDGSWSSTRTLQSRSARATKR
jgi:NitT/TauT family transport system substrate-binding protein